MKRKEINYSHCSMKVVLLLGTCEEISNYLFKISRSKNIVRGKLVKSEMSEIVKHFKSSGVKGVCVKGYRDIKNDCSLLIGAVKIDHADCQRLSKKNYERSLYRTAFHESRHIVDRIIIQGGMDFEDLENTARFQSDIDLEFKELIDQFLGGK